MFYQNLSRHFLSLAFCNDKIAEALLRKPNDERIVFLRSKGEYPLWLFQINALKILFFKFKTYCFPQLKEELSSYPVQPLKSLSNACFSCHFLSCQLIFVDIMYISVFEKNSIKEIVTIINSSPFLLPYSLLSNCFLLAPSGALIAIPTYQ